MLRIIVITAVGRQNLLIKYFVLSSHIILRYVHIRIMANSVDFLLGNIYQLFEGAKDN